MKRMRFLNQFIFLTLFCVISFSPGELPAVSGHEARITAPDESVSIQAGSSNPDFFTDGWICGDDPGPKVIKEIRKANEISAEISRMIQDIGEYLAVIKAVTEEGKKRGSSEKEITDQLAEVLKNFSFLKKKNEDQSSEIKKIEKEISNYTKITREIEKSGGSHVLYGDLADTSLKRVYPQKEEVQDNYVTYALSDCYKKSDIDVFMNNQLESYQRAINLFSEYEKMKKEYVNYLKGKF